MASFRPLSNEDIEKRLKKHSFFMGVYPKDECPAIKSDKCAVLNLQNATNSKGQPLPGTHWICCGKIGNKAWYFDPFGLDPPIEAMSALGTRSAFHTGKELEGFNSDACGQYCIAFCEYLYSHCQSSKDLKQVYNDFCDMFNQPKLEDNDRVLKDKFF